MWRHTCALQNDDMMMDCLITWTNSLEIQFNFFDFQSDIPLSAESVVWHKAWLQLYVHLYTYSALCIHLPAVPAFATLTGVKTYAFVGHYLTKKMLHCCL